MTFASRRKTVFARNATPTSRVLIKVKSSGRSHAHRIMRGNCAIGSGDAESLAPTVGAPSLPIRVPDTAANSREAIIKLRFLFDRAVPASPLIDGTEYKQTRLQRKAPC